MVSRYEALAYPPNSPLANYKPQLKVNPIHVEEALSAYQLNRDHPILVLCPGAEFGPSKRWPEKYYAQVASHYLAQNWQVWILGSQKDTECANLIQSLAPQCRVLTGQTSLAQAIDLMSIAQKVLTNDSGLMHIAGALNRPLVALFGSTSPEFTPPLNPQAAILTERVACSPCFQRTCPLQHHQCMHQLSVTKVIDTLDRLVTT